MLQRGIKLKCCLKDSQILISHKVKHMSLRFSNFVSNNESNILVKKKFEDYEAAGLKG